MKPIPGKTVQSILRGPADSGHIGEMSQFLRRQINVWGQERSILFGRCHHRQPHVILAHSRAERGDDATAAGHFSLSGGSEPRNAEAGRRPNGCAFDCVSDQTGYPATILRQIVAQRMLVKLYHARLRGRDHQFQCSRCSISGGGRSFTRQDAIALLKFSKDNGGHAHLHWRNIDCRECRTRNRNRNNPICCFERYVAINGPLDSPKSLFATQNELYQHLKDLMNSEQGKNAVSCIEEKLSCDQVEYDDENKIVVDKFLGEPISAFKFFHSSYSVTYQLFKARWVIMILLDSTVVADRSVVDILTIYPSESKAKRGTNQHTNSPNPSNSGTQHNSPSTSATRDTRTEHDSPSTSATRDTRTEHDAPSTSATRDTRTEHDAPSTSAARDPSVHHESPAIQPGNQRSQGNERKTTGKKKSQKTKLQNQDNEGEEEIAEKQRIEQEIAKKQRIEQEIAEKQRIEKEIAEEQRIKQKLAEEERIKKEIAEKQRTEKEIAEEQRIKQKIAEEERIKKEMDKVKKKNKRMRQKRQKQQRQQREQQQNQPIREEPPPPQPSFAVRVVQNVLEFGLRLVTMAYGPIPQI